MTARPAPREHWPAEALWAALEPQWPGLSIEVAASLPSTNTTLLERLRDGDTHAAVLAAEAQTAGRGRRGRTWQARAGDTLCFSVGLPLEPADWSGASLAVGVALAEALGPSVRLKWPNDLWCRDAQGRDAKLGGILIETATLPGAPTSRRHVVVGVGLNVRAVPEGDFDVPPAAWSDFEPGATAPALWLRLVPAVLDALRLFERAGLKPFLDRFASRDALAGRLVSLHDSPDGLSTGRACGVAPDGSLLLEDDAGRRHNVRSADVRVRPC